MEIWVQSGSGVALTVRDQPKFQHVPQHLHLCLAGPEAGLRGIRISQMDYKAPSYPVSASLEKGSPPNLKNVLWGVKPWHQTRGEKMGSAEPGFNKERRVASVAFGLASNSAEMYP